MKGLLHDSNDKTQKKARMAEIVERSVRPGVRGKRIGSTHMGFRAMRALCKFCMVLYY